MEAMKIKGKDVLGCGLVLIEWSILLHCCRIKKAKRGRVLGDGGSSGGIFAGLTTSQPLTLEKQSLTPPPSGPAPVINSPPKQDSTPYLVQLKSLNESVSEWIQKHVSDNPYVDLTPIFKDYTTHLAGIETKVYTLIWGSIFPSLCNTCYWGGTNVHSLYALTLATHTHSM